MMRRLLCLLVSFAVFVGLLNSLDLGHAFAQANGWSPRERIPGSHDLAVTPLLVADTNGTVHAFHAQAFEDDESGQYMAIFHSTWSLQGGWTKPIDVILPPHRSTFHYWAQCWTSKA